MDTAATERERALEQRVKELERENALLKTTPPAPPAPPTALKRKKRCILDDSESDSDGGEDGGEAAVPVTQSPRPRKRPKSDPLADEDAFEFPCGDWQRLTPAESDRFVQRLLKERGFGFDLLPHQFLAARRAAGLPDRWPTALVEGRVDATVAQAPLMEKIHPEKRHFILADEMGLGKTVEALAAAELRRAVPWAIGFGAAPRAVAVVAPNAGVLDQWVAHIGRAGGDVFVYAGAAREKLEARLALYAKQPAERARRGDRTLYVVMDRYGLQTAVKHAVDFSAPKACALFPDVATDDLLRLGVLKMAKQDPRKFKKKLDAGEFGSLPPGLVDSVQLEKGGTDDESTMIADIVQRTRPAEDHEYTFDFAIVDEAHLLKNDGALWGIGAALIGHASRRFLAVTGTPFNNSYGDIAALIRYGQGNTHAWGRLETWHDATWDKKHGRPYPNATIVANTREWREHHITCRSKAVTLRGLPPKTVKSDAFELMKSIGDVKLADAEAAIAANIKIQPLESTAYLIYEQKAFRYYCEFAAVCFAMAMGPRTPALKAEWQRLMVLACGNITCAKTALVHPVCPREGRSITAKFVDRKHTMKTCALCGDICQTAKVAADMLSTVINRGDFVGDPVGGPQEELSQEELVARLAVDDLAGADDIAAVDGKTTADEHEKPTAYDDDDERDGLVTLPKPFCCLEHRAHRRCYQALERAGKLGIADACPFCDDLKKRLKMGAEPAGVAAPRLYCKDVAFGGFAPTTKMLRAFAAVEEACGKGDKMIIFGGNKASLDLIEAALIHEPEFEAIGCFRYDGDISQECRNRALRRFKAAPRGAVLLTTVQTSGVGLNITEANHVLFLDRWFNPTTHDQAMDRTHRYGQKKPVEVTFLDCEDSVDKVMRIIDEYKSQNAKVATANEGDLPGLAAKKVSWKMLCGVVKDTFKEIFDARAEKMGITRLLATTYDNAGAGDGGGPVPFNYDAAVGDPWAPLARRAVPLDWKPAKREPKAEDAVVVTPPRHVIDLRGDSDVEMVAAPAPARQVPIEIDSDEGPSPIAVDADGEPWTCARCTYADNRPCFLCCEMCGGERAS